MVVVVVVVAGWGLRHCDDGGVWRREGREWRNWLVFLLEFELGGRLDLLVGVPRAIGS